MTGGIGTYLYEMAAGLARRGWPVTVLAQQNDDSAVRAAFNAAQAFEVLSRLHPIRRRDVWEAVRRVRPSWLIAGNLEPLWVSWPASQVRQVPMIAIGHGSEFRQSPPLRRRIKQVLYGSCQHVVLNSQFTQALMQEAGIRPRAQSIIYPGGNAALHQPDVDSTPLRDRYKLHGKRVLVTVGTVSPRKGQAMVIRALPKVLSQIPQAHYLMIGRDDTDGDWRRLAVSLGVEQAVTYGGIIPSEEKAAAYNLAEFCLLTSQNIDGDVEGYGIAVIEAALCRRTTIGTRDCGVQEAIQHRQTGWLVPQKDPTAIAGAIINLLTDTAMRDELAQTAYERAIAQHTWAKRVEQFEQVLRGGG